MIEQRPIKFLLRRCQPLDRQRGMHRNGRERKIEKANSQQKGNTVIESQQQCMRKSYQDASYINWG